MCMPYMQQLELYTHAPCMPQTLLLFQPSVENWIWRKWRVTSQFPLRSPCLHHESSRTTLLRTQWRCSLTISFVKVMRDVFGSARSRYPRIMDLEKVIIAIFKFAKRPSSGPISKSKRTYVARSPRETRQKDRFSLDPSISQCTHTHTHTHARTHTHTHTHTHTELKFCGPTLQAAPPTPHPPAKAACDVILQQEYVLQVVRAQLMELWCFSIIFS